MIYRQLIIDVDPMAAGWISHLPGAHRCMDNERVMLWAEPPLTVQCDGWLIDGQLVSSSAVSLTLDRDRTAEPLFSLRSKAELPAPQLRLGCAVVDQNKAGQVVRLPITLSNQDYISPEALQFTLQVPGLLPKPELTPAAQLAFALQAAPSWLTISNNGDGTAVISGSVPPTRDTWQVFAIQVFDPLSRATSQATMLLTFDPAVGGVLLTVINGTGGGLFGSHLMGSPIEQQK